MTRSAINKAAKTYDGLDVSLKETAICTVARAARLASTSIPVTLPDGPTRQAKMAV